MKALAESFISPVARLVISNAQIKVGAKTTLMRFVNRCRSDIVRKRKRYEMETGGICPPGVINGFEL